MAFLCSARRLFAVDFIQTGQMEHFNLLGLVYLAELNNSRQPVVGTGIRFLKQRLVSFDLASYRSCVVDFDFHLACRRTDFELFYLSI